MAIGAGLTSAIVNPLDTEMMNGIRAADVVMGADEECAAWIAAHRQRTEGATARRARRITRRRTAGA
jgi:5-methyltetrahydrofolate--homocysteine methyltransferase